MAGELGALRDGFPVSIPFSVANPAAAATTPMVSVQGNVGYVVPAGYNFFPMVLMASANAAVTAGVPTLVVSDNAANLLYGLTVALGVATQQAASVVREGGVTPIAAGHVVGVNVVTNGAYAPATLDYDVTLCGVLIAA